MNCATGHSLLFITILTEAERRGKTIMWLIIFGLMILAMCAGVFYLVNRFYKIPMTEKLSGGRKPVRILIAVIPLAVIVGGCWLAWGMTNAIVVSLHVCAVWLIADLISFIVRKIRKKDGNYTVRAVSVLAFSAVYLGVGWYLAHHVWRTQYNVETDKTFGELRIVQISDSHVGATFHADGTSFADMEESSKALGDLKTKYGVYFVFGNHDKGYYGDERRGYSTADLVANLEANNVTVLEDENVLIDDRFYLIGRQDASEESRAEVSELFKEIDNIKYTIVLDHQPNDYDAEEAVGADMVLSGHTHGGQLIPITYVGEWTGVNDATYGIEKRGETTFITSSGISDWEIKFKTGCKSEYSVIDISDT